MRKGVNVVRGKVSEKDELGTRADLRKLLAHARRMTQVARRVVDSHCNPVFRNGLMVYVQQMESGEHNCVMVLVDVFHFHPQRRNHTDSRISCQVVVFIPTVSYR